MRSFRRRWVLSRDQNWPWPMTLWQTDLARQPQLLKLFASLDAHTARPVCKEQLLIRLCMFDYPKTDCKGSHGRALDDPCTRHFGMSLPHSHSPGKVWNVLWPGSAGMPCTLPWRLSLNFLGTWCSSIRIGYPAPVWTCLLTWFIHASSSSQRLVMSSKHPALDGTSREART